jgi:uncharacterized protein (TIGR00730 family)
LVSIFGGARIGQDTKHFFYAHHIAKQLVERDISVVTGGGPGIMEAANCGALAKKKGTGRSIGIGVSNLGEGRNPCVHEYFELSHFFARKWLLTQYSHAFIVFPGGFGTLDELFEVLTLMQTKQMKKVPIILIEKSYWDPLLLWIEHKALLYGALNKEDIGLFYVTDNLDEVVCIVQDNCVIKK